MNHFAARGGDLVHLVYLVSLVYFVCLVHLAEKRNKPDERDKPDKLPCVPLPSHNALTM
jgi:hypothetical protein